MYYNKLSKIGVVIILTITLIGTISYFLLTKRASLIKPFILSNTDSKSSDQKIYQNKKYGFELSYPQNYFDKEDSNPSTYGTDYYFNDKYENLFLAQKGEIDSLPNGQLSLKITYVPYIFSSIREILKEKLNPYKQELTDFNTTLYLKNHQSISHYKLTSLMTYSNVDNKYLCEEDISIIPTKENATILFNVEKCIPIEISGNTNNTEKPLALLTLIDNKLRDQILSTFTFTH